MKPCWAIYLISVILKIRASDQTLDVLVEIILHSASVWKDSNQVWVSEILAFSGWIFQPAESSEPKWFLYDPQESEDWTPNESGHENLQKECLDIDECMDNSHLCVLDSDCVNNEGLGKLYHAEITPPEFLKIVPNWYYQCV